MAVDPNFVADHFKREAQGFEERIAILDLRIGVASSVAEKLDESEADLRLSMGTEIHTMRRQKAVLEMMLEEIEGRQKRIEDALK